MGNSVVYSFADPGKYTVKLTVTDDSDQEDKAEVEVLIKDYPVGSVKEPQESAGMSDIQLFGALLNILIIALLAVLLFIYLRKRD